MKPSIGRIVHYVPYGTPGGEYTPQCRAAVITELTGDPDSPDQVSLAVFNPTGMFFNQRCSHSEPDGVGMPPGGSWHWPEREKS